MAFLWTKRANTAEHETADHEAAEAVPRILEWLPGMTVPLSWDGRVTEPAEAPTDELRD